MCVRALVVMIGLAVLPIGAQAQGSAAVAAGPGVAVPVRSHGQPGLAVWVPLALETEPSPRGECCCAPPRDKAAKTTGRRWHAGSSCGPGVRYRHSRD
jgi:hypothetical protein